MTPLAFIVVHGGAGVHGHKDEEEVKVALRTACTEALKPFASSKSNDKPVTDSESVAQDFESTTRRDQYPHDQSQIKQQSQLRSAPLRLVETAICSLEDDPCLNAGYGSNLTVDGTVECDASIMYAHASRPARFGSVGAMSGIKNPISAARVVLEHSEKKDGIGRIPPLTLVSTGAYDFASSRGVRTVPAGDLITALAKEKWQKWKERLESYNCESEEGSSGLMDLQDTVGAVAFHETDGVASGVSSGGLLLKYPGRVGEAALYGAGCWAESSSPKRFVACSVSGTGEHITKFAMARRMEEIIASPEEGGDPHEGLESLLKNFWELGRKEGDLTPSAGLIVLIVERDDHPGLKVRLWCAFTTVSMAIAHASTKHPKPKVMIVRRPYTSGDKPQVYITSWLL